MSLGGGTLRASNPVATGGRPALEPGSLVAWSLLLPSIDQFPRGIGHEGNVVALAPSHNVIRVGIDQTERILDGSYWSNFRYFHRLRDGRLGQSKRFDFSLRAHLLQLSDLIVERDVWVNSVQVVNVDGIDATSAQAKFNAPAQVGWYSARCPLARGLAIAAVAHGS
ncbi:hypothetical protein EMIT0232MI5_30072 [Pseudomonas sp. IT-232MI5]